MARTKRASIHYVNNKEFSQAVVDYVRTLNEAQKSETKLPIVPNYIASCFLKIAEGLSHKSNFIRYTYREEMVMDAVENCLRAIDNYNIEAATRTGNPMHSHTLLRFLGMHSFAVLLKKRNNKMLRLSSYLRVA